MKKVLPPAQDLRMRILDSLDSGEDNKTVYQQVVSRKQNSLFDNEIIQTYVDSYGRE